MKRLILTLIIGLCLGSLAYAADTGYNWGSWGFVQDSNSANWDDATIADNETETSGVAIDLDGKAACIISIQSTSPDAAIDGDITVYVLADTDGTNYEGVDQATYSLAQTPVQDDTIYFTFSLSAANISAFKIAILNESGQIQTLDIRYKTATIPPAS